MEKSKLSSSDNMLENNTVNNSKEEYPDFDFDFIHSFDGKEVTENDKKVMNELIRTYLESKKK
ncbi:hypothetical protein SAMN02745116_01750 [Pilibacter termitis]|uniref:Uncharacterized protein n=1 Tax=Pilibacter termitis TaxID=263852 RepID=A0A1T4PCL7_9ENTE|nr:hypothetical protein [Pilibacter termitis]SJZ89121.1 hypothetical protein SAMN02745116_01750 [Pilibacter termitis]